VSHPLSRKEIDDGRLVAPAVSVIVAAMDKRPYWAKGTPFPVPPDVYKAAREEMTKILEKRGFELREADALMIYGTRIVATS